MVTCRAATISGYTRNPNGQVHPVAEHPNSYIGVFRAVHCLASDEPVNGIPVCTLTERKFGRKPGRTILEVLREEKNSFTKSSYFCFDFTNTIG